MLANNNHSIINRVRAGLKIARRRCHRRRYKETETTRTLHICSRMASASNLENHRPTLNGRSSERFGRSATGLSDHVRACVRVFLALNVRDRVRVCLLCSYVWVFCVCIWVSDANARAVIRRPGQQVVVGGCVSARYARPVPIDRLIETHHRYHTVIVGRPRQRCVSCGIPLFCCRRPVESLRRIVSYVTTARRSFRISSFGHCRRVVCQFSYTFVSRFWKHEFSSRRLSMEGGFILIVD